MVPRGFPGGAVVKNPPASAGDTRNAVDSIPGSERSPGGGNGNPLQHSCLGNHMDRGAWQATVQGHKEPDMTEHWVPLAITVKILKEFIRIICGQLL